MDEDLFSTIEAENYGLARDLIRKGAKADILLRDGISVLHLISGHESQEASKVLEYCARHSDLNVKSLEGLTPVHVAALWGRLQNLKILTSYGGDIYLTDDEGNNALDFACLSGENDAESCIKFLLELENSKSDVVGDLPAASYKQSENSKPDVVVNLPTASHEQSAGEFSDSFYTAIGDESVLDKTDVTFPKLHPWNVKICSKDFDVTVIDDMNDLSINASCSFADSDLNDDSFDQENRQLREQTFSLQDSIIEDTELGDTTVFYDWKECSSVMLDQTDHNESVVIPESILHLSVPDLRKKLEEYGEIPGPINQATKHVYIKRLARLLSGTPLYSKGSQYDEYLPEIRKQLEGRAETPDLCLEEESMCQEFDLKKNWREGTEKSSFNYLLIDPRVTQNLPARARKMNSDDVFRIFIMSIFYVGKGKRSRPYCHLNEALQASKYNAKIQQIKDIWDAGLGVVSLHIFQSVIPVEAYTREACMIDALGLSRLTNKKRGDYYGRAQTWPQRKRREMGVYLLKRALQILLYEGERQLRPGDLRVPHSS